MTVRVIVMSTDQHQGRIRFLLKPDHTDPPRDRGGILDFVQFLLAGKPTDPFDSIKANREIVKPLGKSTSMQRTGQGNRRHHRMRTSRSKCNISDSPLGPTIARL